MRTQLQVRQRLRTIAAVLDAAQQRVRVASGLPTTRHTRRTITMATIVIRNAGRELLDIERDIAP